MLFYYISIYFKYVFLYFIAVLGIGVKLGLFKFDLIMLCFIPSIPHNDKDISECVVKIKVFYLNYG